jgi:hypothetical protein
VQPVCLCLVGIVACHRRFWKAIVLFLIQREKFAIKKQASVGRTIIVSI